MEIEKPGKGRAKIIDRGSGIDIIIPVKKNIFALLFLPFWLAGWLFGVIMVVNTLFRSGGAPAGFLIIWLAGWTVGGIFAILIFFWNLAGKEIAAFDVTNLVISKKIAFLNFRKKYAISNCEKFRVDPSTVPSASNRGFFEMLGYGVGRLVFDYGMKTVKFASGIDEAEAAHIIKTLQDRGFIKKQ